MRTDFVEQADTVKFVISDYSPEYVPILKSLFYRAEEGGFVKEFPCSLATPRIRDNFARYAREIQRLIITPAP